MIHTSMLQEMNSPTQERSLPRRDQGGKLYPSITNLYNIQFPAVIEYWLTGPETFDYTYSIVGDHGIPKRYLDEMIEEIIQKEL